MKLSELSPLQVIWLFNGAAKHFEDHVKTIEDDIIRLKSFNGDLNLIQQHSLRRDEYKKIIESARETAQILSDEMNFHDDIDFVKYFKLKYGKSKKVAKKA